MRTITLPGTDLETTHLGFGSAALMARLGRRESVRLLELAYEAGIRHFDTARAYGYGEAESAVGEFLKRHGDAVTVTTKFGLVPPRRSRTLRAVKSVARVAARRTPALRRRLRLRAHAMVQTGRFGPDEARASFETSLSELGVESVDVLLLHECRPADLRTEGLLDFLESLVQAGRIRYFGTATDEGSTRTILNDSPGFGRITQLRHNALEPALTRLPGIAGRAIITHSSMRVLMARLTEAMRDEGRRQRWSDELEVDCSRREVLGGLLMSYSLQSNPDGVVLFSSTDETRIRSNAALVDGDRFSPQQVERFARLSRETVPHPAAAVAA